jgi:hypothetical protein
MDPVDRNRSWTEHRLTEPLASGSVYLDLCNAYPGVLQLEFHNDQSLFEISYVPSRKRPRVCVKGDRIHQLSDLMQMR